ncbi:MFS transporter [Rhodococcus aetherivorans]|uniref:MFS transporter n=1 Tax=Rhodococcus aetherivorans TaxID=191292 RepID=UPI000622C82E|nr:MFS transporter [Rhodococcus aetherivorans]AKE88091.1 MFS transporter [Rhodococcus aetherivorans]MDV6295458.1 MFS transporter [Rhodococcus aetherivorans]
MVAYAATRELVPLYGLYALLFEDHGLGTGEISSLFVLWSVVAFVAEVPSGAWADTVSRRGLLLLSAVLFTAGFALWLLFPGYWGFAAGFVAWGISESLKSGTFEALVYDELSARGAAHRYPAVLGYANAGETLCVLVATLSAAPLFAVGGYATVGWLSVAITVGNGLLVLTLPAAPRHASADETGAVPGAFVTRYLAVLHAGTSEARRSAVVRRAVLLAALLSACLAFEEYFALLAREGGSSTSAAPVLVAITVAGQVLGAATAGRTAAMTGRAMGAVIAAGGVLLAAGAALGGAAGFVAIGIGYGALHNAMIVAEARMQDAMSGTARATVTSVSGLVGEVASVAVYAGFALGTVWLPLAAVLAAWAVPLLGLAVAAVRWLPPSQSPLNSPD